jgi:hypothetical protein
MGRLLLASSVVLAAACRAGPLPPIAQVAGTWGGDNAGLIATDSTAHVHIGCTLGDTKDGIHPDASGHFDVSGTYNVDVYPVARGITHPARFSGSIIGATMVLTVTLTDTTRQLGPVQLTYGSEPRMGPCPICRVPPARLALGVAPEQALPSALPRR